MKFDGAAPLKGHLADRIPSAKPASKPSGKSFAAAFEKAGSTPSVSAHSVSAHSVSAPAVSAPAVSSEASPVPAPHGLPLSGTVLGPAPTPGLETAPAATGDDYLETIKFRMRTGYYNSKSVDDALSEKLTDFFDELA